jgi:hypothetical protein
VLNEISTNRITCASSKTSGIPLRVSRRRKDYTVPQKISKNDIISQAVIAWLQSKPSFAYVRWHSAAHAEN